MAKPLKVFTKYFHKSKYFLYPITGLKPTDNFNAINTYICWPEAGIDQYDCSLIAVFKYQDSQGYKNFENQRILLNPYFKRFIECEDGLIAYVFSFENKPLLDDYFNFLLGRYSELSPTLKSAILKGTDNLENKQYLNIFLNPDRYFEAYARDLILHEDDFEDMLAAVKECGQLCDIYDIEKETCKVKIRSILPTETEIYGE